MSRCALSVPRGALCNRVVAVTGTTERGVRDRGHRGRVPRSLRCVPLCGWIGEHAEARVSAAWSEETTMALGVHSEVGTLRKVIVHRPGLEHSRLTPSNAAELLFDDVIWVARAKQEHDAFAGVMRDRGVEVFEAEQLLAETLVKPEVKDWVCEHILSERQIGISATKQAHQWVQTAGAPIVAEF